MWRRAPLIAIIVVLGIVITAAYLMRAVGRIFFGQMPEKLEGQIEPTTPLDNVALVLLSGIMIVLGVYPAVMAPMIESGAEAVLRLVGGA